MSLHGLLLCPPPCVVPSPCAAAPVHARPVALMGHPRADAL
ncbi:hypothetical protein DA2_1248 [Desulfovibrio sp. A2]|nr:hypothetical protein DA2_1248 [Desulfovibrio sp. A2]